MPSYRPWGSTEDGAIEFESLTIETLDGALNVYREAFCKRENVCQAVELLDEPGAVEELGELCLDAARDGVSVVAIDISTREVVGVAFNKIQIRGNPNEVGSFEQFSKNCKTKSTKALVNFMIDVDAKLDLFKHYNADCILEIMFLATLDNYKQRRIGELLVSSSLEIGRHLFRGKSVKTPVEINDNETINNYNSVPSLVSAIMTSSYSQKISDKLGFDSLIDVSWDEFTYSGKKFSEKIPSFHKSARLVAKRLSKS
ncbi:hypothetical protein PV325_000240 [Microctonus aethiopoides]|nr:hypothetical protein PV325_000240 [Microctonus aethiopoides]